MSVPGLVIRPAGPDDCEVIVRLIRDLAEYERAPEKARATPALIREALFAPDPSAEALIAERDGHPVGFSLFYRTFSTWEGRPGIWLEDLYVPPDERRGGVGQALLARLAQITVERGYTRLEWTALEWNTPALSFYEKLGAERLTEWRTHRLDGERLARVAQFSGS